ncbi:MAG: NAD-dependent epimerase/dehydratase family protein [Proteobacteria bacterium]|nr:NAD-dependent epimerase/dehydratase family protein [Pseudomonadota bacterium]
MHVLVTGAAGFLAGHCVKDLLAHGHTVRGTVRDPSDATKVGYLKELGDIELVTADLTDDAGWDEAVAGCDVVLHTASPFFLDGTDDELVGPAVAGTLRILKAASKAGVKRVVMTSSTAAIVNCEAETYTEAQWSVPEDCSPYPKSKTLAERAAWDFVAAQPEQERLELVTCNPCLILGPLLSDRMSLSLHVVKRVLGREMPGVPHMGFSIVDVRDVAIAHRLAAENPTAAGNRYLLMAGHSWLKGMALTLKGAFGDEGFNPPTLPLPYPLLWLVGRFDSTVRAILPDVGAYKKLDSHKARTELGWAPRDVQTSIVDTGRSLIDRRIVTS